MRPANPQVEADHFDRMLRNVPRSTSSIRTSIVDASRLGIASRRRQTFSGAGEGGRGARVMVWWMAVWDRSGNVPQLA
jgi:hypothetical protein